MMGLDVVNSLDKTKEEKEKYHNTIESLITIADQCHGNLKDRFEVLEESFRGAEKRHAEDIVDNTSKLIAMADVLNFNIGQFNKFFRDDPTEYHSNMKSASVPLYIMLIQDFKNNDLAKNEYGVIISDFLEVIFVEIPFDMFQIVDGGAVHNVLRSPDRSGSRIRIELPHKECYNLISILYQTYIEIGRNDLTEEVTSAVVQWLDDNQTIVKFSNKK